MLRLRLLFSRFLVALIMSQGIVSGAWAQWSEARARTVLRKLSSDDPIIRWDGEADMRVFKAPLAFVMDGARSKSSLVRASCVRAATYYSGSMVLALVDKAYRDNVPLVREAALLAMSQLSIRKALPLAVKGLDDRAPEVRRIAVATLSKSDLGQKACVRLAQDPSPLVRAAVAEHCMTLLTFKQLMRFATDRSSHVRLYVASALRRSASPEAT